MKNFLNGFLVVLLFLLLVSTSINASEFDKTLYANRRAELLNELKDGVFVLFGNDHIYRNSDITYRFRQNSDFYYLTGFEDADAVMVLQPGEEKEYVLFLHKKHFFEILFAGEGNNVKTAMEVFGADTAYYLDDFEKFVDRISRSKKKLYYNFSDEEFNRRITKKEAHSRNWYPDEIINPESAIHQLRVFKDEQEIELVGKANEISCDAIAEVMRAAKPGMNERELEGILNYVWMKYGSPRFAYPPIIASGERIPILHYEANDADIKDGELVMMDVACEYGYYSADVTRTFPINGKFTKEQKEIYEIALASLNAGIEMMKPGVKLNDVNQKTIEVIADGLFDLGLITDKSKQWQTKVYYSFYCGHFIGLDTHDVGHKEVYEPGMIFAIEPGIYVNPVNFEKLPAMIKYMRGATEEEVVEFMDSVRPMVKKYANVCGRAEDNILITDEGNINLTKMLAKTVDGIERLMAEETKYIKE